jgi:hypothetical protein
MELLYNRDGLPRSRDPKGSANRSRDPKGSATDDEEQTMTEAEWFAATDIASLLAQTEVQSRPTRKRKKSIQARDELHVSHRQFQLFGVACCRFIWHKLSEPTSRRVVEVGELFADGEATSAELADAQEQAWSARTDLVTGSQLEAEAMLASCAVIDFARVEMGHPTPIEATQWTFYDTLILLARCHPDDATAAARYRAILLAAFRDIVGNPFRPVVFDPEWRTSTAVGIAKGMYESRDFSPMPILADALQDAGCDHADILNHCRDTQQVHVRGCWVVDGVLGKS